MAWCREQELTFLISTSFSIQLDIGSYFSSNFTIAEHWFSKFAELHKMWRCIKPCTSALFSFDKFTMKNKDNYKEQPSNIQRVSPCIALPVWGKLSGRQQWQKQTNQGTQTGAAKKHWDWNSFLKSYSSSSSAMFTAGNMTYMRKRKKERQAAKRAMARENVSLWNP